jgi:hypothetical protein
MANKLTVVFSGKKQSGKSSAGKFVFCEYVNRKIGQKRLTIEKVGKEIVVVDTFKNNAMIPIDTPSTEAKQLASTYSVKMYSFADPLKAFCINVLGLDHSQCYGTDDDKNSQTHISWDDLPLEIREKYSRPRRGSGGNKPASGYMTAREVMQVFGTDMCRRIDNNCWARGLYSTIKNEEYELAIVTDARFPNEVTLGTEDRAKVVRLQRKVIEDAHDSEHALDDFPLGEYSLVIDNQDMTLAETHKALKPHVLGWFDQYKLS